MITKLTNILMLAEMKPTILLVVASIHLASSYYNQTALSSVLSKFEAQLIIPRRKDAEQTAPETSTAPAAPARKGRVQIIKMEI